MPPFSKTGFSLVELSIVLVILGLLTGGILAGQSLIHAAELRSVSSEFQRYVAARRAFQDKYFAIPGDMSNATSFWGKDATNCNSQSGTANATTGTCNGDGNNMIGSSAASSTGERAQFWRHLALAGLIEGNYTGINGSGGSDNAIIGVNAPASKLSGGGWNANYYDLSGSANGSTFSINYGNELILGAQTATSGTNGPLMKPEDAWNIDTKLDDGKPGSGKVFSANWSVCTDAADSFSFNSSYKLSNTNNDCFLRFPNSL